MDVVEGVQVIEYENIESQAKTKVIMKWQANGGLFVHDEAG